MVRKERTCPTIPRANGQKPALSPACPAPCRWAAWWRTPRRTPQRHDIDLGGLIAFVIDDVITETEADNLIAASEHFGFRAEAPGIATPQGMRMNIAVHWMADENVLAAMFGRIAHLLPEEVDGANIHPQLSHRINVYRYR